jgi:hypothetical protein
MKLDDLMKMNIPRYSLIEIEADAECIPLQSRKTLGYFNCIKEDSPVCLKYYLAHFQETGGWRQTYENESAQYINRIRSVKILVPKQVSQNNS